MSAEESGSAVAVVNAGPVIITVPGQDGHVVESAVAIENNPVAVEGKPAVVEVKKEATGSEEQVEEESRDEKGRFKPGVQTRIDELTRKRHEAERETAYWKGRAEGAVAPEVKAPAETPKPPVRETFDSDDAFQEALVDFKVDQKLEQRLTKRDQEQSQVAAQTTKAESWQSKLAAARTDIPDFDSVMNAAEIRVDAHVADLILEHDHGARVAHHLAVNPAELEKINAMSPSKAAFAIADIASQFKPASSSEPVVVAKPAVKVSEAPPPAARNVGSGRSTTVPLGEQSMDDYIATRKAQGARWAR